MGSRRGGEAHQRAILHETAQLAAHGRVILCHERLPHDLAVKDGQVWGIAPRSQHPETRPGKGAWRAGTTKAALRRRWPHLDGVHVYNAPKGAAAAARTSFLAALERDGWRTIQTAGKCPDALLVRPDGSVAAVEVLGLSAETGEGGWTKRAKREHYGMFDGVLIRTFRRPAAA